MKLLKLTCLFAPVLAAGCVHSHRAPVVYTTPAAPTTVYTTPATVPVTPTSPRPEVRVYAPEPNEAPGTMPVISYVNDSDLAIAQSIRRTFSADTDLASASRNMRMTIRDGHVVLTGNAPSENARQLVERTLTAIPGVVSIDDQSRVDLH